MAHMAKICAIMLALTLPSDARKACEWACGQCAQSCRGDQGCLRSCMVQKCTCCQVGGLRPGPTNACPCGYP